MERWRQVAGWPDAHGEPVRTDWSPRCQGVPQREYLQPRIGGLFFHGHDIAERDKWRDGYGLESFIYDAGTTTRLGRAFSKQPVIMCLLAVGTVLIELGFVVILVSRPLFKL